MSRGGKRLLRALAIIAGVLLVIMTALQIVLNSKAVRQKVDAAAAEAVDGTLSYKRLHFDVFRSFPRIRLTIDDLSLTYPHDRWAAYDGLGPESPLLDFGRGETVDTLASFRRFTAAVNIWRIFGWKLRLSDASLQGLRVAAHAYRDSTANWNIFKSSSEEEADTTASGGSFPLPRISIGPVRMARPAVVYTSQQDTLYALLDMKDMLLKGDVRLPRGKKGLRFRKVRFDIDSLGVAGRLPADTVGIMMERLRVGSPKRNTLDINTSVKTLLVSGSLGYLHVPFELDTRVSYNQKPEETEIEVPHLDLDAAYIPLRAEALLRMLPDSNYVRASMNIDDCSLGDVLRTYADGMIPEAADLSTDARLNFAAAADGWLSDNQVPAAVFGLEIPRSKLQYRPLGLLARLALDVEGSMDPSKVLSATLHRFEASTDGLDVKLSGSGSDLIGADPGVAAHLAGKADLGSLGRFLNDSLSVAGLLDVLLDADVRLSEIKNLQFRKGTLSGRISSPSLSAGMPYDTLSARLAGTDIRLSSRQDGIKADVLMDTVAFRKGTELSARIGGMNNRAVLSRVVSHGKSVPRVAFESENAKVFFRTGIDRMAVKELKVSAALQQRARRSGARRRHFLDSLQRVYPGIPRDSLFRHAMRMNPRPLPSYLSDRDFAKKDIRLDLGPEVVDFLKVWAPSAGISARFGTFSTPRMPLRNAVRKLDIRYDDDTFNVNSMQVKSGTSDLSVTGSLRGLRRTLLGRGFLRGDLDIYSRRLNLNELLSAIEMGTDKASVSDDEDESFVVDSLNANASAPDSMSVIVIPANIDATVKLHADNVIYSDVSVQPLDARIKVAKRCLQLTDTKLHTNLGDISLDAFYATRTKQDIQLGADLQLKDMSAEGIIHTLPMVDNLMPALKSFQGKLGCRVSVTGQLDTMMNVIMPSVDGLIRITGRDLEVTDAGELRKITRLLLFKDKNIGHIDDLNLDAIVENNQLEIYPFILGVDRYQLGLMGVQNLDGKMRYNASILKAPLLPIKFGINISGKPDDMRFSIGRSKYRNGKVPVFTEELDDIQINIGSAIRSIFETGVEKAVNSTYDSYERLNKRKKALGYTNQLPRDFLSNSEYQQLQAEVFEEEMKDYNASVDAEVDAALNAALAESISDLGSTGRKRR